MMPNIIAIKVKNFKVHVKVFRKEVKGHNHGHVIKTLVTTRKVVMLGTDIPNMKALCW